MSGVCFAGFWKYQSEFIAAVARGSIDCAAAIGQGTAEAFDRAAAGEMAEAVVDFLQLVQVEKQNGETAVGAARALDIPACAAGDPVEALRVARSLTPVGGLIVATFVTLFIVPVIYSMLRKKEPTRHKLDEQFALETMRYDTVHVGDNPHGGIKPDPSVTEPDNH